MTPFADHLGDTTLAIYLFHGVTDCHDCEVRNYTGKHVSVEAFRAWLADMSQAGNPVSLEDVIAAKAAGESLPPRSFAVTFDDGFANNLELAAPLLAEFKVPATFYVTTGWTEVHGMSWTDRIEYCIETESRVSLTLPWSAEPLVAWDRASKIAMMDQIRYHAKRSADLDIDAMVNGIFRQCGREPVWHSDHPLDRKMSWAQIAELASHPLFTVGGHTHTHRIMAYLTDADLTLEVETSLGLLAERSGIAPRHYSYPEGTPFSYDERCVRILQANGVVCCPVVFDTINTGTESLMELRRIIVG